MHVRLIIHNKIDTKNDIINVIITALLFLVLMYCVYKLYQNPIPGNDLNIALIVSFFDLFYSLFLINILKPFARFAPNLPNL